MYSPLWSCFLRSHHQTLISASKVAADSGSTTSSSTSSRSATTAAPAFSSLAPTTSTTTQSSDSDPFHSDHIDHPDDDVYDAAESAAHGSFNLVSPANSSLYTITSPASPFSLNVPLLASSSSYISSSIATSHHQSSLSLFGDLLFTASSSSPHVSVSSHLSLSELHHSFRIGSSPVSSLVASLNFVFTAHLDHQIRVWRHPAPPSDPSPQSSWFHLKRRRPKLSSGATPASTYKLLGSMPSAKDFLLNAFTGNEKNYVQVRRHSKRLWIQHIDTITCLAVEPDESLLYSGSWDKTVKVWKLSRMRCIQSIKAHEDAVNDMVIGRESEVLYTASADKTIKGWRRVGERRVLMWTIGGAHSAAVNAVAMSGDARVMYTAGTDCRINVWCCARAVQNDGPFAGNADEKGSGRHGPWRRWRELRGHRQAVLCLASAGPLLCSGSADKTIRVWKLHAEPPPARGAGCQLYMSCMAVLEGHSGPVRSICLKIASTGHCIINSAATDSTLRVWSVFFNTTNTNQPNRLQE